MPTCCQINHYLFSINLIIIIYGYWVTRIRIHVTFVELHVTLLLGYVVTGLDDYVYYMVTGIHDHWLCSNYCM